MKYLRILSVVLFAAAVLCFGAYYLKMETGRDTTPPIISMDTESIEVSVDCTEEELLYGVTASDNADGDVTANLFVEKTDNFSTDHTRRMTIAAYDEAGNVTKASREITYTDYTSPHFTLSAPLKFTIGTTNITENMGAMDVLEGDISNRVKVTGRYTLRNEAGDYPMEFKVGNEAGDVSYLTATVTLQENGADANRPAITLTDYLVYMTEGESLDPWDYLDSVTLGANVYTNDGTALQPKREVAENSYYPASITKSDMRIKNAVDESTPGCYEITYQYTFETYTGTVRLIVVVE